MIFRRLFGFYYWDLLSPSIKRLTWLVGVPAWMTFVYWIFADKRSFDTPPAYANIAFGVFAIVVVIQMVAAGRELSRRNRNG